MAERVGLLRTVTLEWMDQAVNCKLAGKSLEDAIALLDGQISESYQNPVNIRQARTILINMWYRPEDWFLAQSLLAAEGLTISERIPLHWALLIERYQFFYDLSSSIGRLFAFRDEISIDLIRSRVFEIWGLRGTLDACIRKNVKTIREMNCMQEGKTKGFYTRETQRLNDVSAVQLLCAAVIDRSGKEYMSWEEFISHPALFPFQIESVTQADMASCEHLCLERMGDDVVIRVK